MSAREASQPWPLYPVIPEERTFGDARDMSLPQRARKAPYRPRYPLINSATPGSIPGTQSSQSPTDHTARIFVTLSSSPNTQGPPSPFNRPPTTPPTRPLPPPPEQCSTLKIPPVSRSACRGVNGHLSFQRPKPRYLSPPVLTDRPHFPPISQAFQFPTTPASAVPVHMELPPRVGLGIDSPQHMAPSITIEPTLEDAEKASPPNIAQRLESRLWKYNHSDNVLLRWFLEILSWLISALSMAAIIGMLLALHNKERPNWPFGLTLNAYISVLSRIAAAGFLVPTSEALGQLKWYVKLCRYMSIEIY